MIIISWNCSLEVYKQWYELFPTLNILFTLHFNKYTVLLDSVVRFRFPRWVSTYKKKMTSLLWILLYMLFLFPHVELVGEKNGAFSITFFVICLDLNYLLYLCSYHSKNGKQNLASASWREKQLFCVFDACGEQALTRGHRAIIEKQILIDLNSFLCPFWWECKTA